MIFNALLFKNVPELPDTTEPSRTDLSRDLAALHEICVAHSDELRTLSNERGAMQVEAITETGFSLHSLTIICRHKKLFMKLLGKKMHSFE